MIKKSLLFGGITLMVLALMVLVGCPDVVTDDPGGSGVQTQTDLTITAAATTGANVIGIQLTSGKFVAGLETNATQKSKFVIKNPDGTVFNLGTDPIFKLNPGRTVLTITLGTGADTIPTTGNLTVIVPGTAVEGNSSGGTGGTVSDTAQTEVSAESAANAAIGANAIKIELNASSFVPGITVVGTYFEADGGNALPFTSSSEVVLSNDNKTATIYGTTALTDVGPVKIKIKPSALFGYPIIAAANVTVSGITVGASDEIVETIIPHDDDDYIRITLSTGTFVPTPPLAAFTLVHPATGPNAITIGSGSLEVNTDNKKVVIKPQTPSDGTTSFKLRINTTTAFNPTPAVSSGYVTAVTTKQGNVVVPVIETSAGTEDVLTITINNGGKFITPAPLVSGIFTQTGTGSGVTFTSTNVTLSSGDTVAKITLSGDTTDGANLGVTIDAAAFDSDWLVESDDITLSLGDT
ncbi:MAG: hypothetical protein LBO65_03535 [Spirochaetaceae bacterium]|jgi:hypothetical protein|nr:hypothetical protein [Spirochaetaceae bacterium]